LIVCLPGPHDEVELLWPVLRAELAANSGKKALADSLAEVLRNKFRSRCGHHSSITEEQFKEAIHGSE
jgi:hypothetical protein